MTSGSVRSILELKAETSGLEAAVLSALDGDVAFTTRLLATIALPGLGRRSGIEAGDLLPIFGLRFIQQVVAGLLLEDAGADATGSAILSAIAAQCIATRISLPRGEEAFLAAWLSSTPAWRQAPSTWGPGPDLVTSLDLHARLGPDAPLSGSRADLVAQVVRLGETLANLASPYPDTGVLDLMQRSARVGLSPAELKSVCEDIARHAEEWGTHLGHPLKASIRLDLDLPEHASAARFATELATVYRYLLQNAAIDAETGLPNARYFRARLESEWAAARRRGAALSVIAVETRGDAARTAHALRETARLQDVVCRSGDAQFMLICSDTHAEYAKRAAARLRQSLEAAGLEAALGVATLDSMISSVEDLIERAQAAARRARDANLGYCAWGDPE